MGFWKDSWYGETALCNAFPNLFNLAGHKGTKVENVWDSSREEGCWSTVFVRTFNDWEVEEVERFLHFLHNKKINPFQEDQLLLKEIMNDGFSIRLIYCKLMHSLPTAFPSRFIWNPIVPLKLGFFA